MVVKDASKNEAGIQKCIPGSGMVEPGSDLCLPLKSVQTMTTIHESLAHVNLTQQFINPSTAPLELTFRFPKLKGTLVSRLTVSIGDSKVIEAKIMEKQKAEAKYDDAIAAGHGAIKMSEAEDEVYELNLGNIQPNDVAVVNI